ncbi:MAG: PQQ-binding-like beta-propeller repeat protein [Proteobacteria bacterium]|nr:PQQ-binding-like beta-propeller repeat protein [Pseudomonadota bacterium]
MNLKFTLLKLKLLAASLLLSQVYAAASFTPDFQPLGYIGPIELSNVNLANGSKAYRGWFENAAWQGDLIEYDVSSTGALTTSIDLTGPSPVAGATTTNWSAHVQFATNELTAGYWNTGRQIFTYTGSSQVAFRWSNLSTSQKQAVDLTAYNSGATFSSILNFVRGERINEYPTGNLRLRFSVLGDIIHSNPEYVGAPEADIVDSSYVSFVNANVNRAPRVYVGANDGMLHAFDALTGDEVWAYIPLMVIGNVSKLAGRSYLHSYFVDGGLTVQDAFFGSAWHSVLVGSLGGGGKGLFALDVTHPDLSSENFSGGNDKKVLWELDGVTDNDMGYIFGATTATQLNDGKWYAINGNGVSSVNGIAVLYLVDIQTGVVTKISTGSGAKGKPNGLAAPALVDTDNDGMADIAYAGDIDGDMWKFDLTGSSPAAWKVAYKLYNGVGTQPITVAPDVANHPQSGHLVLYGTGRLYTAADIIDTSVQALYGIWDTGSAPGVSTRLAQILSPDTDFVSGAFSEKVRTFTTTAAIDWSTYKGWKVDLPAGERLITPPQLRASRLKTTITNPDGYSNWLLEVTFDEGGVDEGTIFDLDRNGLLEAADRVDNNADGDLNDPEDIPMGWKLQTGNMSQVTIGRVSKGFDTLFLNFLNPPLVPPACTGDCTGGLAAGHIDVDTDSSACCNLLADPPVDGLGGSTVAHEHEYDDKTNRTYVDYFDIDPNTGIDLENIDDSAVGIGNNEEFIILIANADLSPGSELTIGTKKYHVVTYQRMIHKKLAAWDGVGPLVDDEGVSLIHKLANIQASGGTLRSTFDSLAIINGGLHPTQTECVNKTSALTNGRWRNGSLIIQLIKRSHFAPPFTSALDLVTVQNPSDLKSFVILSDGTQVNLVEDLNGNGVIDAGAPDYEAYGGLIVTSNAEFLYESTIFWHFGEISKLVFGTKPCYGDEPDWSAAYIVETQGVTQDLFANLLVAAGFADFDALVAEFTTLESCKDTKEKDGGCKDRYKELSALYNLGLIVTGQVGGVGSGGLPPTGLDSITGSPVVIEGGVAQGGVTSGPNFETGRRTWIDITPQ